MHHTCRRRRFIALLLSSLPGLSLLALQPGMTPYADPDGNSGIAGYRIGDGQIEIEFKSSGRIYTYTEKQWGADIIQEMQRLAKLGNGLNSYMNKHVRRAKKS